MAEKPVDINAEVSAFKERNSPAGLLRRYARGRVRHFASRQILTVTGAAVLMWISAPWVGLAALAMALFGEGADCLFLRGMDGRLNRGSSTRNQMRLSFVFAIFQAVSIGACITLAWATSAPGQATFFFYAFLTGAALNAGLIMPYFGSGSRGKLAVYAMTAAGILMLDVRRAGDFLPRHGYDCMGILIMGYMSLVFVNFVNMSHIKARNQRASLLREQQTLARTTLDLAETQREAQTLSLVARHAHDSIILAEPRGGILWVNTAFTKTTGYTLEEAKGKTLANLLNGPDSDPIVSAEIGLAVKHGRPHRAEVLNYTKSGQKLWVQTYLVPVPAQDGADPVVISIERDITASHQHAEALAAATEKATAASKAKSEFLATMSHEIRTPMNGVIGMADLLHETDLSPEQRGFCNTIRASASGLLTIINDILDFSRLDAGRMELSETVFELRSCVSNAVEILRPQAMAKGLELTCDYRDDLPQWIRADEGRLRQILINLLGNAVKFTETGSVSAQIRRKPGDAETTGDMLEVAITDTGIGISPEATGRVFEQFAQADGAINRRFGGTGLGLAVSRRLAQAMGGDICLQSQLGQGSCFTLTATLNPAAPPVQKAPVIRKVQVEPGLKVLVAEDNRTNRMLIKGFLKDQPIDLSFTEDGELTVQSARQNPPDLIFMDVSMPQMDGLEATRAIRASCQHQPVIIALTANAQASDRDACLGAGMDDFLTKPVRKPELLAKMAGVTPRAVNG